MKYILRISTFSLILFLLVSNIQQMDVRAEQQEQQCRKAPAVVADLIGGLLRNGGIITSNWSIVRSKDFNKYWFLSGAITEGLHRGKIITFATNAPRNAQGTGLFFAMGPLEQKYTGLGLGQNTKVSFQTSDHGWAESRTCVRIKLQ